jgi:hypothetical protein
LGDTWGDTLGVVLGERLGEMLGDLLGETEREERGELGNAEGAAPARLEERIGDREEEKDTKLLGLRVLEVWSRGEWGERLGDLCVGSMRVEEVLGASVLTCWMVMLGDGDTPSWVITKSGWSTWEGDGRGEGWGEGWGDGCGETIGEGGCNRCGEGMGEWWEGRGEAIGEGGCDIGEWGGMIVKDGGIRGDVEGEWRGDEDGVEEGDKEAWEDVGICRDKDIPGGMEREAKGSEENPLLLSLPSDPGGWEELSEEGEGGAWLAPLALLLFCWFWVLGILWATILLELLVATWL